MRKKLFTFLLALTASIGMMWAETVVVINKSEFTSSGVTKEGVTLAPSSGSMTSSDMLAMDGSFEFSTSLGKFTGITIETDANIMQIYENGYTSAGWPTGQNLGTSAVWTGESEKVFISCMVAGNNITITCTIEPAPNPSGECGENLTWELNTSTGVLTITGSGAMYDWTSDTERPWYSLRAQITSVVLPSGITSLGKYAFRGTDIVSINMTENYPAGLTTINQEAFFSTQLTSVTIPESVVTIGQDAFRQSLKIENVYCYADPNNLTWNDFYCDDFKGADHATVCHVKACALATYEANWGGTPYNAYNSTGVNVTFVGDLPGECGGASEPATGLQVVEVTSDIYNGWNSNGNTFSVNALPGFQAVTFDEAKAWTEVPTSGTAVLVYRTNGDYARVIHFFDGTITGDYDVETDFNQIYENITIFGNRFFYTVGGSTPASTPSVTAARFLYNYDCQRAPAYPQQGSPCTLSEFKDPYVGYNGIGPDVKNTSFGPWKLEFLAYYTPSNDYGCQSVVSEAVYEYYSSLSSEEKEAKKLEVPIFRLWQYNIVAGEYQPAAYGIVCAYAAEGNAQDHAALFISSEGGYGCFLSGHQHTTSFALTCENDLTTGLDNLIAAASATDPYYDVVWPVILSIDAIGTVELTQHCKDFIEGSRAAYNALTDEQKAQITNYSTLTDAEAQWAALVAEAKPYADAVVDLINAIPNPVVYTQECKDAIDAAQDAYDALTDGQKMFVSNYETLKNAQFDLINAAPYVHILFKANGNEKKVENVTLPKAFSEAEMKTILKELYGVEGDYDMYAHTNADAVNIIYGGNWTISPFMGTVNVEGAMEKFDPGTGYEWFDFSLDITLELPPFGPAPTSTDEQVPTNADPKNPSYHYSTFFHSTQNYKLTNDGTQAFIATLSNNDLVLTEIANGTQVIPANTAVIFRKSGSADPVVLTPTDENGVSVNPDDNSLEGVDDATPIADKGMTQDNCYVLSGTAQYGVGFYKINSTSLKAHKAYVIYNGSAAPKRMRFIFNQEQTATGMENVQGSVQTTKILRNDQIIIIRNGVEYTINGQIVK